MLGINDDGKKYSLTSSVSTSSGSNTSTEYHKFK